MTFPARAGLEKTGSASTTGEATAGPTLTRPSSTAATRRALACFRSDFVPILVLMALIGTSVCVALLEAWPLAILIDSVLSSSGSRDAIHQLVLSYLPVDRTGQIIALVAAGLVIQAVGYVTWTARMMLNAHLRLRGTARVRSMLFAKLQSLGRDYHKTVPQGDSTFRLTSDVAGPWGIMDLGIGTAAAAVTLLVMTAILLSRSQALTIAAYSVAPFMLV